MASPLPSSQNSTSELKRCKRSHEESKVFPEHDDLRRVQVSGDIQESTPHQLDVCKVDSRQDETRFTEGSTEAYKHAEFDKINKTQV